MLIRVILLCFLAFLFGCEEKNHDAVRKTLIMGTSADYKPFEFIENDEIVGFDVDIAKAIAKELDFNLEIKDMDFASLIPSLNSGHIDFAMASITPSPERAKHIDFSNIYYTGFITVVTGRNMEIREVSDLTNMTIGAQLGTLWEKLAYKQAASDNTVKVFVGNRIPQLIEELKIGRIDAFFVEEEQARQIVQFNEGLNYKVLNKSEDGVAIAFAKKSKLTEDFNQALENLEKKGELSKIRSKWLK